MHIFKENKTKRKIKEKFEYHKAFPANEGYFKHQDIKQ